MKPICLLFVFLAACASKKPDATPVATDAVVTGKVSSGGVDIVSTPRGCDDLDEAVKLEPRTRRGKHNFRARDTCSEHVTDADGETACDGRE